MLQLSTSTGADGFVAKNLASLADLKGKTLVTQINGPHLSLIGNMLKDAGLQPGDVQIKFVKQITADPGYKPKSHPPRTRPTPSAVIRRSPGPRASRRTSWLSPLAARPAPDSKARSKARGPIFHHENGVEHHLRHLRRAA